MSAVQSRQMLFLFRLLLNRPTPFKIRRIKNIRCVSRAKKPLEIQNAAVLENHKSAVSYFIKVVMQKAFSGVGVTKLDNYVA